MAQWWSSGLRGPSFIPRPAGEATEPCLGELGVQRKAKPQNVAYGPVALWPMQSSPSDPHSPNSHVFLPGFWSCSFGPNPSVLLPGLSIKSAKSLF